MNKSFEPKIDLDTPINLAKLSVRTSGCLHHNGIKTIRELCTITKDEFYSFRNFGKKALAELVKFCDDNDIPFIGSQWDECQRIIRKYKSITLALSRTIIQYERLDDRIREITDEMESLEKELENHIPKKLFKD